MNPTYYLTPAPGLLLGAAVSQSINSDDFIVRIVDCKDFI